MLSSDEIVRYVRALMFIFICGYLFVKAKSGIVRVIAREIGTITSFQTDTDLRTFPLVTFCPLYEDVEKYRVSSQSFSKLKSSEVDRSKLIYEKMTDPEFSGKWTKTYRFFSHVMHGAERLVMPCHTYEHGKNIKVGSNEDHLSFMLKMTGLEEMEVIVHEDFGYMNTHYKIDGRQVLTLERLEASKNRRIRIDIEPFTKKKLQSYTGGIDDCTILDDRRGCIEKMIQQTIKCNPPWRYGPDLSNSTDIYFRDCETAEDLHTVVDMIPDERKVGPTKLKNRLTALQCEMPCVFTYYKPRVVYDLTSDETISGGPLNQEVEFIINLWNGLKIIEADILNYDSYSFLGDLGGYMGLLLGYSLLSLFDSFYQYITDFIEIYRNMKEKRAKKPTESQQRLSITELHLTRSDSKISIAMDQTSKSKF